MSEKRSKGGRPRIKIDEEEFKNLCKLQCTLAEIASFFNCSGDTIERWCKRELKVGFAEAFKNYSAGGKISLRRWQFRMAETNCTMAIWLGKQWLGQTDKQDVAMVVGNDKTIEEMEHYFEDKQAKNP